MEYSTSWFLRFTNSEESHLSSHLTWKIEKLSSSNLLNLQLRRWVEIEFTILVNLWNTTNNYRSRRSSPTTDRSRMKHQQRSQVTECTDSLDQLAASVNDKRRSMQFKQSDNNSRQGRNDSQISERRSQWTVFEVLFQVLSLSRDQNDLSLSDKHAHQAISTYQRIVESEKVDEFSLRSDLQSLQWETTSSSRYDCNRTIRSQSLKSQRHLKQVNKEAMNLSSSDKLVRNRQSASRTKLILIKWSDVLLLVFHIVYSKLDALHQLTRNAPLFSVAQSFDWRWHSCNRQLSTETVKSSIWNIIRGTDSRELTSRWNECRCLVDVRLSNETYVAKSITWYWLLNFGREWRLSSLSCAFNYMPAARSIGRHNGECNWSNLSKNNKTLAFYGGRRDLLWQIKCPEAGKSAQTVHWSSWCKDTCQRFVTFSDTWFN